MELNKIYCGDCGDLFETMADKSVDYVFTSPPPITEKEMINMSITMTL